MAKPWPTVALIRREILSTLRGARAAGIMAVCIFAFALLAISEWPEGEQDLMWSVSISQQLVQEISLFLFAGCVLFVPAFSAGAIVLERERGSYDLLTLSLIRPSGIIIGKLCNAIGFFVLVLIACLPILAVSFFLVGVDIAQVTLGAALILMTAVSCAMAGILSSTVFRRSFSAMGGSYLGALMLLVGPLFVTYMTILVYASFTSIGSVRYALQRVYLYISPFGTLLGIFEGTVGIEEFAMSATYQLAFIAVCFWLALRFLKRPLAPPKSETEKPIDDAAILATRRKTFPYYLVDPLKRKKSVEDGRNPMMVREVRWGLFSRGAFIIRMTYTAFALYFFAGSIAIFERGAFTYMTTWMVVQMALTILIAPAIVSNTLTKEHELGNADMLRMTLLRPSEIILGKFFASIIGVLPIVGAAALSAVPVLIFVNNLEWELMTLGYLTLSLCAGLSIAIGMLASMFTKRTAVALTVSYLLNVIFFGAVPYAIWILLYSRDVDTSDSMNAMIAFLSPIYAFSFNAEAAKGATLVTPYWLANSAYVLLLTGTLVAFSVFYFKRYRMRDR